MNSKLSYIKRSKKYIIGAMVLATSLGSYSFGGAPKEDKALGQSLNQSTGQVLNKDNNGYYQIGSSADLREFANLANGEDPSVKGKLTSDIEFNTGSVTVSGKLKEGHENFEKWTPIGTKEKPFEGELISENGIKKITGLYIDCDENYQGLFGCVGQGGKVSNIKIDGSYIKGKNYVGGIAGYNEGEIRNPITGSGCIIEGEWTVGWTVGGNMGCNSGVIIGKCENSGEVKGNRYVGGNVGQNEGEIKGSYKNSGKVTGNNCVGGNIGCNKRDETSSGPESCENSGEVEGNRRVGGNVGLNEGTIEGCKNNGIVNGENCIGGNFGQNNAETIKSCKNEGVVRGESNVGGNIGCNWERIGSCKNEGVVRGKRNIGGNVGCNKGIIEGSCENSEKVTGEWRVGGNVGCNITKIEHCKNEGVIKGKDTVGGNVGCNEGGTIRSSENSGTVEGIWKGCYVGCNEKTVEGCENSEKVNGGDRVGGNIGLNWAGKTIKSCNNSGKITGKNNVGGNVGENKKGFVLNMQGAIESCKNRGEVTGEENVGGNIGNNENIVLQGDFINDGVAKGKKNIGMNVGRYTESQISYHLGGNGKLYEIKVNAQGEEELERKNSNRYIVGLWTKRENKENLINTGTINGKSVNNANKTGSFIDKCSIM